MQRRDPLQKSPNQPCFWPKFGRLENLQKKLQLADKSTFFQRVLKKNRIAKNGPTNTLNLFHAKHGAKNS